MKEWMGLRFPGNCAGRYVREKSRAWRERRSGVGLAPSVSRHACAFHLEFEAFDYIYSGFYSREIIDIV